MEYRIEKDNIGSKGIPTGVLYGIHAARAKDNFPNTERFSKNWYKALGLVKLASYQTYGKFKKAALQKYGNSTPIAFMSDEVIESLQNAAREVSEGEYFDDFIVPAVQGGAGTSINMNVNEIIANKALLHCDKLPGSYEVIDPVENANVYQSTNDVIPTSLRVASMFLCTELEQSINLLRHDIELLESEHRNHLRIAFTQMQQAVPSSWGRLFGTYNEALSRDWWRISRAQERLKVVNLGGSAIGSGITVPRYFIMNVVPQLQQLTGLPLTRSENMYDATNNLDAFIEVHGFLKAHAVSLEKMVNDLRLLSSDLLENKELHLPRKQVGSSIMPGKVNPVIPEYVISVVQKVYANDMLISALAGQGTLDLNAYIPSIGHALLNSLELLIGANETIRKNVINGIQVDVKLAEEKLFKSPAICTALLPFIGYHKAEQLSNKMLNDKISIFEANQHLQAIDPRKLISILSPSNLLKEGFSLDDL